MANTYTVRDTKTGKVIRKSTYGDSISSVKLKSRTKTVSNNIKSSRVSSSTARSRAKQDLISVAVAEQKKQAEFARTKAIKDNLLKAEQLKIKEREALTKALKEQQSLALNRMYTKQKQNEIFKQLAY
jgi:CobQ-like glutamine amidotransferase family enzyme